MNNNPEGTPNPLNPSPVMPPQPAPQPTPQPTPAPEPAPAPAPQPAPEPEPTPEPQPVAEAPAPAPAPAEKKKTGLIVTIIIFVIVAIACAITALIMLHPFGNGTAEDDRVPKALANLFVEGAPTNIGMDGTVSIYNSDETSEVMTVDVDFTTKLSITAMANTTDAKVTVVLTDGSEMTFNANEVHTQAGDLYLKLSNIPATLGNFSVIDGQWILIPSTGFSNVADLTDINTTTQCMIDAFGTIDEYTDDFAESYKNNQFVTYSTEDLKIAQKKNNLYRLGVDTEKFTGFLNSMNNSGFVNELNACAGETATNKPVTEQDVTEIIEALPVVYVEIGENYQFTRVYLKATSEDGMLEATADIDLSYPEKITVTPPEEYLDINALLSSVLESFYGDITPEE